MRWSWTDLEDTPAYVRRYSWDLMQARLAAEQAASERTSREHGVG